MVWRELNKMMEIKHLAYVWHPLIQKKCLNSTCSSVSGSGDLAMNKVDLVLLSWSAWYIVVVVAELVSVIAPHCWLICVVCGVWAWNSRSSKLLEMDTLFYTFNLIDSSSPSIAFSLIVHKTESGILEVYHHFSSSVIYMWQTRKHYI